MPEQVYFEPKNLLKVLGEQRLHFLTQLETCPPAEVPTFQGKAQGMAAAMTIVRNHMSDLGLLEVTE